MILEALTVVSWLLSLCGYIRVGGGGVAWSSDLVDNFYLIVLQSK